MGFNIPTTPLDSKEMKPFNPEGNKPWIFTGRTDAEAEAPILWPPDLKSWLIGKDSDAWKDWGQEEKGVTGWDCWMASLTQWTWIWASSGRWWRTGKPGLMQSMGLQRVRHNLATEQQHQTEFHFYPQYFIFNYKILKNMWQNGNNSRWWEYGCVVIFNMFT